MDMQNDPDVVGVMLQGSLARGDGYPGSDLDLFVLVQEGCEHSFLTEQKLGILIEHHRSALPYATAKVRANPMLSYGFTDGRILRDDTGGLAKLVIVAEDVIRSYKTSSDELKGILYWLLSAAIKIKAASDASDLLKASFICTNTAWKVLEGMWAVNELPMPPAGAVLAHRHDLNLVPENWEERFDHLFQGNTSERVNAVMEMIGWLNAL